MLSRDDLLEGARLLERSWAWDEQADGALLMLLGQLSELEHRIARLESVDKAGGAP